MHVKGGDSEAARQKALEKQRTEMLAESQRKREEIVKDTQVRIGNDKFVSQNESVENELKRQTVGLVRLEDFQRIRDTIQAQQEHEQLHGAGQKG